MSKYAEMAQSLVLRYAEPFQAFDTPGAQLKRAYDNLHGWELKCGWSKCWNAFYRKAGKDTYYALREHSARVRQKKNLDVRLRAQFISTLETMRDTDAEFFGRQIEAYSSHTGGLGRKVDEGS